MASPTQKKTTTIEAQMRLLEITHVIIDHETHGQASTPSRRHLRIYYADGSSTFVSGQFWIKHHGPPGE